MSDPTLNDRLSSWLEEEASEATAEYFTEDLRPALRELGYAPTGPCTEAEWDVIRGDLEELLDEAGIPLSALKRAAEETRRAREKGWTLRDWMRKSFRSHLSEEDTEEAIARAERWMDKIEGTNDLDASPQPEDILTYRRLMDAFGGGATLASIKEHLRRYSGGLPAN